MHWVINIIHVIIYFMYSFIDSVLKHDIIHPVLYPVCIQTFCEPIFFPFACRPYLQLCITPANKSWIILTVIIYTSHNIFLLYSLCCEQVVSHFWQIRFRFARLVGWILSQFWEWDKMSARDAAATKKASALKDAGRGSTGSLLLCKHVNFSSSDTEMAKTFLLLLYNYSSKTCEFS